MRCTEFTELLDLYVDGDLPEETGGRIERHLLRCADCAHKVRSLEQTRAHLRAAYPPAGSTSSYRERASAKLLAEFSDTLAARPDREEIQWTLPFDR